MRKSILAAGTAMLVLATAAHAQEAAQAPASDEATNVGIADIIVTAQRRAENVQKSSLAIQVLDSAELTKVSSTRDLQQLVPGLLIGQGGALAQVYIRGVGDFSGSANSSPGVGYSTDGVIVARPEAVSLATFDVARVEVLKGPQGTLFGRNSTGGTINVINRRPEMGKTDGYITAEAGNLNLLRATGALNVSSNDSFAARLSFDAIRRDGYLTDGTNDEKHDAARLMLSFKPTDRLSIMTTTEYVHVFGKGAGFVPNPRPAGTSKFLGSGDPAAIADLTNVPFVGPLLPLAFQNFDPFISKKAWLVSAEIEYDMDWAKLKILPAYRDLRYSARNYPGIRIEQSERSKQYTGEVQLGNTTGGLTWVTGLYYFNEDTPSHSFVDFGPETVDTPYPISKTRSIAAFGQASYAVVPGLRLIAGGRYTKDHREFGGSLSFTSLIRPVPPTTPFLGKGNFNSFTWKAGAEYDLSPVNMLFATASTGFKAGGFNGVPATDSHYKFKPEKLTAFQIGSRNRFLDNRLQVNLELFYWLYKDHQEGITTLDDSGAPNYLNLNAGKGRMYGFNIDVQAKPTSADTLRGTVEYNNAKYTDFVGAYADLTPPVVQPGVTTGCPVQAPSGGFVNVDCSGYPLARAPRWTGSAGWSHKLDLSSGASLESDLNMSFSSKSYATSNYTASVLMPSWVQANASLTYRPASGSWSLTGYVNNITNELVASGSQFSTFAPPQGHWVVAPPRTYGGRLTVNF